MPNIRRGIASGARGDADSAAFAKGASIESRNGSDRAAPVPRRKERREMARRLETKGAVQGLFVDVFMILGCLLVQEQLTLHDRMHEAAHPVLPRARKLHDAFNLLPVGEAHRRTRRVNGQL